MNPLARHAWALAAPAMLLLSACNDSAPSTGCAPTDPACTSAVIDTIVVTSTIDTVIAVGSTTQAVPEARAATGTVVPVTTWGWTSLHPNVAPVHPSTGLVTGQAPGTATIRVSQTVTPGVTGDLRLRVVDADLPAVTSLVSDELAEHMRAALTTTPRGAMTTILSECATHVTSGNLLALDACLASAAAVGGGNANDTALLNVLDLFYEHARRQLRL